MIEPELETARPASGPGFGDAVTFAFGDPALALYGSARLGLVPGAPPQVSGLGLLFHDGELAALDRTGGIELEHGDWTDVAAGDVRARILEPLCAWEVAFDGEGGGFELRFDALGAPAALGEALAASAADLHGYEQLCRVSGNVRHGERRWQADCLGQRGHQWGAPDWERIELARTVAVWLEDGEGVVLAAMRPRGAAGHERDATSALLLGGEAATPIDEARLSTASDAEGRQRRAGLELWIDEEDPLVQRLAGEAVCGTTLELGRLRLDCAFFQWRTDGRRGTGRYDVLRRA